MGEFVLDKLYENCPKSKEKCYFTKLTSIVVISTGTTYLVQRLDNNIIWSKKMDEFGFWQSVRKLSKN